MQRQFKITGLPLLIPPATEDLEGYTTQHAIILTNTRNGGNTVLVSADDDEIAEFLFEDDTSTQWSGVFHPPRKREVKLSCNKKLHPIISIVISIIYNRLISYQIQKLSSHYRLLSFHIVSNMYLFKISR